jgi:hypothetical protein
MTITTGDLGLPPFTVDSNPDTVVYLLNGSETTAQAVNKILAYMQTMALTESNNVVAELNNANSGLDSVKYNLVNGVLPTTTSVPTQVYTLPDNIVRTIQTAMQMYPLGTNYAKNFLDGMNNSWVMKFFPAAIPGGIDTLLQAVTQSLVPEALQEIMWSRAKAQGMRDNARFEDEQVTTWASRGFSMPSGVLANQLMMKQQQLAYTNADLAAQQAVKALDIQIDGIKFAADLSVKLQLGLINGMNGLIDAYNKVASEELNHNAAMTNATNQLFGGVTAYYDTLVKSAATDTQSILGRADIGTKQDGLLRQAWSDLVREKTTAALTGSQVYAQMANAAFGGLHGVTSASVT